MNKNDRATWLGFLQLLCCTFFFSLSEAAELPLKAVEEKSVSTEAGVKPLVGDFKVTTFHLANGLKILVLEDHASPTFAYQTWFKVGSKDEQVGKTGLAHFFEHMMFKGTKNYKAGEFDRLLEKAGVLGENAFTSHDYTAYVQELPKDQLELVMKLESDRMTQLVIDEKGFKTEREVVQNERRLRTENSQDGTLEESLFDLAFKRHPYHWPVIGYEKDLNAMRPADAMAFYRRFYSPAHATVVVVGDVNTQDVLKLAQKYYGSVDAEVDLPHFVPKEPPQMAFRKKELKLNIELEKILMGYHSPQAQSPDTAALEVLQNLLAGSKSSRLNQALVETGIASAVDCGNYGNKDPSLFVISATLQQGKRAEQAEKVILNELSVLQTSLISTQELQKAKNKFNFSFYEGLSSNFSKAMFLGHHETLHGDFQAGLQLQKAVDALKPRDIQRVAQRYFQPRERTVIVGTPKLENRLKKKGSRT
ncbi:MAG: M16 family metallopeptidase [Bdellovibrionia bacterium]